MDIVKKYLRDQERPVAEQHITMEKTPDKLYVFYADVYDPETGAKYPDKEVISTITKKEVNDRIADTQGYLAKLQTFLIKLQEA